MSIIQQVNIGASANDGSGDTLRNAFDKLNQNITTLRSDFSTAPRAVLLGDSITNYATDTGANFNTYHGSRGYFTWLQVLLGFPFHYEVGNDGASEATGDNAGIGGDTTADMLARLSSSVLSRNPDIVFFMGGTNDIKNGENTATITANIELIIDMLLAHNIIVVLLPITPRLSTGSTDWANDAERRTHHAVNHWLRDKAKRTHSVLMLDVYPELVDEASAVGSAQTELIQDDGIHPTIEGAYAMAKAGVQKLESLICPVNELLHSASDLYHASENPHGNLLENGLLAGDTGNASTATTGDVADDWRIFRSGGSDATIAASKIARPDSTSGVMQRMEITTTGAGTDCDVYFAPSGTTTSGIVTGTWYEGLCEISVSASVNGNQPLESVLLEIWDITSGGSKVRCFHTITGQKFPDVAWKDVLKTPPLQLIGTNGLRFRVIAGIDESVADSLTIDVGRCAMREVVTPPVF